MGRALTSALLSDSGMPHLWTGIPGGDDMIESPKMVLFMGTMHPLWQRVRPQFAKSSAAFLNHYSARARAGTAVAQPAPAVAPATSRDSAIVMSQERESMRSSELFAAVSTQHFFENV